MKNQANTKHQRLEAMKDEGNQKKAFHGAAKKVSLPACTWDSTSVLCVTLVFNVMHKKSENKNK